MVEPHADVWRHSKQKRVLIVDGDRVIADTLAQVFAQADCEVGVAYSAERALTFVEQWNPDVAIIEFIMSGMNGLECANHLRDQFPEMRILLFYAQLAEYLLEALANGAIRRLRSRWLREFSSGHCHLGARREDVGSSRRKRMRSCFDSDSLPRIARALIAFRSLPHA
jgi:CheY-like chemotaxis protein